MSDSSVTANLSDAIADDGTASVNSGVAVLDFSAILVRSPSEMWSSVETGASPGAAAAHLYRPEEGSSPTPYWICTAW